MRLVQTVITAGNVVVVVVVLARGWWAFLVLHDVLRGFGGVHWMGG